MITFINETEVRISHAKTTVHAKHKYEDNVWAYGTLYENQLSYEQVIDILLKVKAIPASFWIKDAPMEDGTTCDVIYNTIFVDWNFIR